MRILSHFGLLSAALIMTLLPITTFAQVTKPARPKPVPVVALVAVRVAIDRALAQPVFRNASVAVYARALEKVGVGEAGRVLYERNINLALMPASNMKILTSLATVARLGLERRFTTTVYRTGVIGPDGTLHGNLFLRGGGDPSLTMAQLGTLADAIAKAGVKRVEGDLIVDATLFDSKQLGYGWEWDDLESYYAAPVSALCLDENVAELTVTPSATVGGTALVQFYGRDTSRENRDKVSAISVLNRVQTVVGGASAKPDLTFSRPFGTGEFVLSGTIPQGAKPVVGGLAVDEPEMFALRNFRDLLIKRQIITSGVGTLATAGLTALPNDSVVIASLPSAPVSDLLHHFLKTSDNLYGEVFLKHLGNGTTAVGAKSVADLLRGWSVDTDGLNIADGSGLSRHDTVTARLLVDTLIAAHKNLPPLQYAAFTDALPVGGVDGTLRNRFKGTWAAGKVRAKTGTLSAVTSLSGTVQTRSGETVVFSILMNNFPASQSLQARQAQETIVNALAETIPVRAKKP